MSVPAAHAAQASTVAGGGFEGALPALPGVQSPKGGGAIRGIGEKFRVNPNTGTASLSLPLPATRGRANFGPDLQLSYDSGAGNGPFGFGWALDLPAVTRQTERGLPTYDDAGESDTFVLSGGEDLVPTRAPDGMPATTQRTVDGTDYDIREYRPRIEGLFARIERWTDRGSRVSHWRSISRDNVTTRYGFDAGSRVADPDDPTRVYAWLICDSYDDRGNAISYRYRADDAVGVDTTALPEQNRPPQSRTTQRYPSSIRYGNRVSRLVQPRPADDDWLFELVFDYGEHAVDVPRPGDRLAWPARLDPFSSYRAGFEVRTHRLCQRILMFHHFPDEPGVGRDCLVRSVSLSYRDTDGGDAVRGHPIGSFLAAVTMHGHRRAGAGYLTRGFPPIEFDYSMAGEPGPVCEVDPQSLANLPGGVDGGAYTFVDLDGEGIPGVLVDGGDAWWFHSGLGGGRLGPAQPVAGRPTRPMHHGERGAPRPVLADLAGGARLSLVTLDPPVPGFNRRTDEADWAPFRPFVSLPHVTWDDPNLRFADLSGLGRPDAVRTDGDVVTWWRSLGEAGFDAPREVAVGADERAGPRVLFSDPDQLVTLADMSGDGLADIVRIRNGEVTYWPNLGYGRFGRCVRMAAAAFDHPDRFSPGRVRLADVDGSGTTDIIYLGDGTVTVYANAAGNSLFPGTPLAFPRVDNLATVAAVDLLGTGTACLTWSSGLPAGAGRALRYVELTGGVKPHLLTGVRNNLGAHSGIEYTSSTACYLADRAAGRPWRTRLPFPVHVVSRVQTYDAVGRNRFVSRYNYHHGYFDPVEREFHGFARVEQYDTDFAAALTADGTLPPSQNLDPATARPAAVTTTWFHTGAYTEALLSSRTFADEYYRPPGVTDAEFAATELADSRFPEGLTPEEARQACRALKGALLRQEIRADDGGDRAAIPYTVNQMRYDVRLVAGAGANRDAVFVPYPVESLTTHYERVPDDPRTAHELTLELDAFGNVLRSAEVHYGRRTPDPALPAADQAVQARTVVTVTERELTNAVEAADVWRTPQSSRTRAWELTGLTPGGGRPRFTVEEVAAGFAAAAPIPFEATPAAGPPQRRALGESRTTYLRDDLSGELPPGGLESLALPARTITLALTAPLLAATLGAEATPALLTEAGYVTVDSDWWIPSGTVGYSPDATGRDVTYAHAHFLQACSFTDAFGHRATVTYDRYDLLAVDGRDALGNHISAGDRDTADTLLAPANDYRVLAPTMIVDENRNRTLYAYDAYGAVAGYASAGKTGQALGDSLDGFAADLSDAQIAGYFADPLAAGPALLGSASGRLVADVFAFQRSQPLGAAPEDAAPIVVGQIVRETHVADLAGGAASPLQHDITYTDGFGHQIQHKSLAEPGPLSAGGPVASPRWSGTGWTILDNKGEPVRQYEPFFSDSPHFEFAVKSGVSAIACRDPLGRTVAMLNPDHTYTKTVFDAWREEVWDAHDTVLLDPATDPDVAAFVRPLPPGQTAPTWHAARAGGGLGPAEQAAAAGAAAHAATPTLRYVDSLGREFLSVQHKRVPGAGGPVDEFYPLRIELDVHGNATAVTDPLGRLVSRRRRDVSGRVLHEVAQDTGEHWALTDIDGQSTYQRDGRGYRIRTEFDALRRPVRCRVQAAGGTTTTTHQWVYGESLPDPAATNHRGQPATVHDGLGVLTADEYDFKGNLVRATRRFATDWRQAPDWAGPVDLDPAGLTTTIGHDALGRVVIETHPDGSTVTRAYNAANLVAKVTVGLPGGPATEFVTGCDYDAFGRRVGIDYGNGVHATVAYDPLTRQVTALAASRGGTILRDLRYTYDAVGNPTTVADASQQSVFFANQVVGPDRAFTYDAVYRLVAATGREHLGQVGNPLPTDPTDAVRRLGPDDARAMGRYRETYAYDAVGNLTTLVHTGSNPVAPGWTRTFDHQEPSLAEAGQTGNRPSRSTVGGVTESYTYDHGNLLAMAHLPALTWDEANQLATSTGQAAGGGTPETVHYRYDGSAERGRKTVARAAAAGQQPTRRSERLYLGEFEIYREYGGDGQTVTLERTTLHVLDAGQPVALVETRTRGSDPAPARLVRYQLADSLGSVGVELDESAAVISYEEYYPFGSTSYQGVRATTETPKRYRFTGAERDEETGFGYHGARYYAPWLARWTSADPAGISDGVNRYRYCHDNPLAYTDPTGTDAKSSAEHDRILADLRRRGITLHGTHKNGSLNSYSLHGAGHGGGKGNASPGQKLGGHGHGNAPPGSGASGDPGQPPAQPGPPPGSPGGNGKDPGGGPGGTSPTGGADGNPAGTSPTGGATGGGPDATPTGGGHDASGVRADGAAAKTGVGGTGKEPPKPDGVALTELDYATKLAGLLDPRGQQEEGEGVSGGIPGGHGPKSRASSVGQVVYIAVNLVFTFFGDQIEKGLQKAWTKIAPLIKRLLMAPAFMFTGAGGYAILMPHSPSYSQVRATGSTDAHHIIQTAAVRDVAGFSKSTAPAIHLPGPSYKVGTPHYNATQVQKQLGGGTYGAERRIGYKSLRKAGLTPAEARKQIQRADKYFMGQLGMTHSTPTRIPGDRR